MVLSADGAVVEFGHCVIGAGCHVDGIGSHMRPIWVLGPVGVKGHVNTMAGFVLERSFMLVPSSNSAVSNSRSFMVAVRCTIVVVCERSGR